MTTEEILVDNIKCSGCVNAVQQGLRQLPGISEAEVLPGNKIVKVSYETINRDTILNKLKELGYPASVS